MPLTKVTRNFQVSIPKEIRERLRLQEGDFIEVSERDGQIVMVPKKLIDADQAWFWSAEWQKGEREVDEDLRAGRVIGPFKTVEEMKKHFGDA
ncbi:MAG: AbrB/MazE/SpoVT family DNA-binding domain-containing protein [Chloroflexi bacterium]|nr:AbrB/MazE/SpoVT family DNA-binding domain-containing protein [Chloroflexota bacterium]